MHEDSQEYSGQVLPFRTPPRHPWGRMGHRCGEDTAFTLFLALSELTGGGGRYSLGQCHTPMPHRGGEVEQP